MPDRIAGRLGSGNLWAWRFLHLDRAEGGLQRVGIGLGSRDVTSALHTVHLTPRRALGHQAPAPQGLRDLWGFAAGQGGRSVEFDVSRSSLSVRVLEMGCNVARHATTEAGERRLGLSLEL